MYYWLLLTIKNANYSIFKGLRNGTSIEIVLENIDKKYMSDKQITNLSAKNPKESKKNLLILKLSQIIKADNVGFGGIFFLASTINLGKK